MPIVVPASSMDWAYAGCIYTGEKCVGNGAYTKNWGCWTNSFVLKPSFRPYSIFLMHWRASRIWCGKKSCFTRKNCSFATKDFPCNNQLPGGDDDLFINRAATKANTAYGWWRSIHLLQSKEQLECMAWTKARHYTTSKYYKGIHKFLLGLFSLSHFLFYPLLVAAMILFNWWIPLCVFGFRFLLQGVVYYRTMNKLKNRICSGYIPYLISGNGFYYLLFANTLFKKPQANWK